MKFECKLILFLFIFLTPIIVRADVLVSELAWMGTSVSANDEWIELHNSEPASISLSGWTLNASDGTPSITLSGSVPAGGYVTLERTDDSSASGVSALVIYSGALGNDGEDLSLKNGSGETIQSLNFSSGWPAGDSASRKTMQWNGSSWVTADPTPGQAYSGSGTTGDDETDDSTDEENTDDDEEEESETSSSSSSSSKPTYTKEVVEIKVVDSSVPVGSPVKFSLKTRDLKGGNILRGDFLWNMGDGTERFYSRNEKFEHTYDHEGTYIVTLKYYSTFFEDIEPDVEDRITLTIGKPNISIIQIHLDGSVELKNISSQEIDLSNWKLKDNLGKEFIIPSGTFIAANKVLVLNSKRTRINPINVTLLSPSGSFVSYKDKFENKSSSVASVSSVSSSKSVSSKASVSQKTEEVTEDVNEFNLNSRLSANASSVVKQKQSPSIWIIVFVVLILGSAGFVFFLYRKGEKEESIEEDEFELLD